MSQPYKLHTLSNGLRFLYLPIETELSVFVSLMGKAGRRSETDAEVGVAHFLEHLFFDGTKRFPTALELSNFIDAQGTTRNGTTAPEEVKYFVRILPENAEAAFDYIADITMNSLLRDEDIEKESKVIKQESLSMADQIGPALGRLHRNNIFPNQTLGQNIFDEAENLPNVNRATLVGYMQRIYHTGNFMLTVAGAIEEEKALALAEQYFGAFPQGEELVFVPATIPNEKTISLHIRDVAQSHFMVGYKGFPLLSEKSILARLVAVILAGGHSSRLTQRLRHDLHLIYSVGVDRSEHSDCGVFSIRTSLEEANIQQALDIIKEEITKITTELVSAQELEKAKNMVLAQTLFHLDNVQEYANFYSSQVLFGQPIVTVEEMHAAIRQATPEDIQAVTQEIFADAPKVTIITSKEKKINF